MENKICVIGVYFGTLPNYFPLWVKSCERNSTVDFFLFCDQEVAQLPKNVKHHPMTLEEMKALAEKVLGFEVCLNKPYKCCDFKPIYGLIFQDYISQYDYWGHCDFDLIFGDLQSMFDRYELYKFDRFLALGHLSLYRNVDEVNGRYKCEGSAYDYKTTFTTEKITVFDELPGMTAVYLKNGFPMFVGRIFADIASIHQRYRIIEEYDLDDPPKNYKYQVFYWEDGKIYRAFFKDGMIQTEEFLYIHFKKRPNFPVEFDVRAVNAFYITNKGFFEKNGAVTLDIIGQMNPHIGELREYYERTKNRTVERLRDIKRAWKRRRNKSR